MIEELKPYSSHRATGAYWLPRVPAHWEIVPSKHVFAERTELARAGDVQLSATQAYGVIPQAEFERRVGRRVVRISMHLDKRSHVEKDDFVISMRSFQGGLERAWASGAIRSSYVVLRPARALDLGYFTHLFKSQPYIKALQATGNFIRDGQDLTFGNFSRVDLPVPPRDEQRAIGRFLDHANRRIDQFIRAKKKLIALLNEQKQAIIHRAVTRGLDPNIKLGDSGISWLGEIPAHWEVNRLKSLTRFVTSGSRGWARFYSDSGPIFLRIGNISTTSISLRLDKITRVSPPANAEGERTQVEAGDVLLSITAQIGAVGLVPERLGVAYVNQHTALIRLRAGSCDRRWIAYQLLSRFGKDQCRLLTNGGTKLGLSLDDVRSLIVLLPSLREQSEIVDEIERSTAGLEKQITLTEREITLAREYRTRLVSDVVTGQLDVRNAAGSLREITEEAAHDEPADDEDADLDSEAA